MWGNCDVGLLLSCCAFRILLWELVSRRDGSWDFHYVRSAYRLTRSGTRQSVLERLPNLAFPAGSRTVFAALWFNGSFFVAITVQSSSITSVAVHTPRRGNSCNTSTCSGWPCAFPMEVMNFRFVPRLVLLTCDLGQTIS